MKWLMVLIATGGIAAMSSRAVSRAEEPGDYQTRTSEGEVSFALTPRPWASGRLVVDVRADTHSGDLAEVDLRKVMALHVGSRQYRPLEAASLGGHHAGGSVTFDLPDAPDRFAITITGVRSMEELRFEWP